MTFYQTEYRAIRDFWRDSTFGSEVFRSAVAFLILALLGFSASLLSPAFRELAMGQVNSWVGSLDVYTETGGLNPLALLSNNLQACLMTILYGALPFLYLPAMALGLNALLLGVLGGVWVSAGQSPLVYLASILPHGIFELPALTVAFAGGLYLCGQLTSRLRGRETAPLSQTLMQLMRVYVLVVIPLLIVSAGIETYITPAVAGLFS